MSNPKLNQIVAVVSGKKTEFEKFLTSLYQKFDKAKELCSGLIKTYQPKEAEGETLPQETKGVQLKITDSLAEIEEILTNTFDAVLTQDVGNTQAKADVVVDGVAILKDVPVTYLMYLEKRVTDLNTFISKIPTLDPTDTWHYDPNSSCYVTGVIETNRTKKSPKTITKALATEHHPAQVDVYYEDVVVGVFNQRKFSGCISQDDKNKMAKRGKKLEEAVKYAREQANSLEVEQKKCGATIYSFLFGK